MFVGDFHNGYLYHFDLSNDRKELSLKEPLNKIANSLTELEKVIFAKGFGVITVSEVGPYGYLYFLAARFGGADCDPNFPNKPVLPTIARILAVYLE